ncbi:uridine kinase [Paraphysoderma sedebokerense]|nr:uridine kinase [Paraphysoderma sedebokerense]KAI9138256.1 uridine kinase [Paraphysoderma sedebokerense]
MSIKRRTSTQAIFNSGRLPWYNLDGTPNTCYIIGIAGGSASGKTTVSQRIIQHLGPQVILLSMDSFYKSLTTEQKAAAHRNEYNFDHPNAFDYDIAFETLQKLRQGKSVEVPIYDFKTHSRLSETKTVYGANVIIFEGIFALYDKSVRDLMDLKIFVDTDSDIRLARRLKRDIAERGRDIKGVLQQYNRFVKPAFDDYILPTMRYADMIVPRGRDNNVAIDLISKHINRQLDERGLTFRHLLFQNQFPDTNPPQLILLEPKGQLKALHTIIRDQETKREDFIFYADRLSGLVVERAMAELPFQDMTVTTPTDCLYHGKVMKEKLCGVSIIRSGIPMETALRQIHSSISLGKLLIQTSPKTAEPQLHYCKLPVDIASRYVILMDATIGTGAAALMAVRVLLDHDVKEENIIFVSLIVHRAGIWNLVKAFPKVKIVTSEVDPELSERYFILPGLGNFSDRYFGTEDK